MHTENKVYLFNGNGLDMWCDRKGNAVAWSADNDVLTVVPGSGDILTKEEFGDVQLHIEFRLPEAKDGVKASTGIYMHGRYQIQITDSFDVEEPGVLDCGAYFNFMRPRVNACKKAGEWQTLDIIFRAPTLCANGNVSDFARATVIMNDVLIHNNQYFARERGDAAIEYDFQAKRGPVLIENKGAAVEFRNIYAINL